MKKRRLEKTEWASAIGGLRSGALVKAEVWQDGSKVVKYSLAYIETKAQWVDNGRVLGYDNAHGKHERHFRGTVAEVEFTDYETTLARFLAEVEALRQEKKR